MTGRLSYKTFIMDIGLRKREKTESWKVVMKDILCGFSVLGVLWKEQGIETQLFNNSKPYTIESMLIAEMNDSTEGGVTISIITAWKGGTMI